jgi:hypothetical protein
MHAVHALLVSLPVSAQNSIRVLASETSPIDVRKLTRTIYPYVQTLAESEEIAFYLANGEGQSADDT